MSQGAWRSGLFGCCDEGVGSCLCGFCCPNCAGARGRTNYDGSNCCFNCCCVGLAGNYNIVREGNGIEGNCISDVCKVIWCAPCVATQLLNQPSGNATKKAGNNRWQHGLFDCCAGGTGIFCLAWCCACEPCIAASARTNFDSSNWCFNCCCLTPCANYNIVREGSGIEGTWTGDIAKVCCCTPCAVTQMYAQAPQ